MSSKYQSYITSGEIFHKISNDNFIQTGIKPKDIDTDMFYDAFKSTHINGKIYNDCFYETLAQSRVFISTTYPRGKWLYSL